MMKQVKVLLCAGGRRFGKQGAGLAIFLLSIFLTVYLVEYRRMYSVDRLHLYRDIYYQEPWPEVERPPGMTPKQTPHTVHYLWCGEKQFRFQHYLSLLSALRILRPVKMVFHYTHLPALDKKWYNVWFQELKQSVALLELQSMSGGQSCDAQSLLDTAMDLLRDTGGVYLSENAVLTRFPAHVTSAPLWFSVSTSGPLTSESDVVVVSRAGFRQEDKAPQVKTIVDNQASAQDWVNGGQCVSVADYNKGSVNTKGIPSAPCIVVKDNVYPKDIWETKTSFARLARWLFYGDTKMLVAEPSTDSHVTPRIGHIMWWNSEWSSHSRDFRFLHFLSVLSALHVAGLHHVYVHGDLQPEGHWWEELGRENVTFVKMEPPRAVFQQSVTSLSHRGDLSRMQILQEHGGVYFDGDVVWSGPIPDWLLRYPFVMCPDWPMNGEWPESFNTGVIMAQVRAPWLRHYLLSLRHYLDSDHAFNSVMMSYRIYERYPDTLYIDRYLQTICYEGVCHPTWHDDYIRDIYDTRPPQPFDWRESRAYHFTVPKPPASLESPEAVSEGLDFLAEIGRQVLEKANRKDLLHQR